LTPHTNEFGGMDGSYGISDEDEGGTVDAAGVMAEEAVEDIELPAELVAVTVNV
jgi:hypothetical protein